MVYLNSQLLGKAIVYNLLNSKMHATANQKHI